MNNSLDLKTILFYKIIFFAILLFNEPTHSNAVDDNSLTLNEPSRRPPEPWPVITHNESQVNVANKNINLDKTGLPKSISVAEKALLVAPVILSLENHKFSSSTPPTLNAAKGGDRITYESLISVSAYNQTLKFDLSGVIEYDGLVSISLTASKVPHQLHGKQIVYRIPLQYTLAKFLHRPAPIGQRNIDLSKLGEKSLTSNYRPFLWIGDDNRGIFWFSESNEGFSNKDNPIRLYRNQNEMILEIAVRLQPDSTGRWNHKFGLLPTPTKSLPTRWRRWRFLPATGRNAYVIWPAEKDAEFRHFGYPQSNTPTAFDRYIKRLSQAGVTATPYACPTWISTSSDEWARHKAEWITNTEDNTYDPRKEWSGKFVNVCTNRNSWHQFIEHRFGDFIDRHRLTGLYMDNAQVYATRGCLKENSGNNEYIEYPMLPQRRIYRTIMDHLRHNSVETFAVVHSSGGINLPSFSSVDAWVNGEQYRGKINRDYLQVASLTDFRVELNGLQWGLIPIFLPEFPEDVRKEIAPTRKLMAILLLHDATPWPQWANIEEINRGLDLLDRFGVLDATFIPYYQEKPIATANNPDIYISGYSKNNKELLIAANLSKSAFVGDICLTSDGKNSSTRRLLSWPRRKPLLMQNSCARVRIGAGEYQMYLSTPKTGNEL